ncbi:undecaprenyl-diphosphate phosphatase [Pseudahrensia aquimaris]|uniref:Undecaprenyl-diphosphatase n=1 Tax=Pseudahrensia aquimaris TaxID=744461 RepID=A0ABW3FI52_9HYPH
MSIEQILILAIVQGLTEFLPVSSSGHLILIPAFTGWSDQGLITDVMVHVGSLFAVLVYFRKDVMGLIKGFFDILARRQTRNAQMAGYIIIATIPALIFGAILKFSGASAAMRGVEIVAWNAVIFGILLYVADVVGKRVKTMEDMTMRPAVVIGIAQALALIPGTSRSGITITAARFMGFERGEAARFSFLLGIPAISVAGLFTALEAWQAGTGVPSDALLAAFFTFFAALAAIAILMALVKRTSFLIFVLYRLALALLLFAMLYDWFPGVLPSLA